MLDTQNCDVLLGSVLDLARQLDTRHGGAARVLVESNPYESMWSASADWASGVCRTTFGPTPSSAISKLAETLRRELDRPKCYWSRISTLI